ncbi:MAG TPA: hypothetical protein VMM13_21065, partial [Euzebya sp.]|nr:hypothetical protein [Euzebya sp.]
VSYPGAREAEPLYRSLSLQDDVHTVLLIANQTLGSPDIAQAVRQRVAQHSTVTVFVLVPATPSTHLATAPGGGRRASSAKGVQARTDDAGLASARWRLRTALTALADLGVVAHGRVGDPNPLTAAARVIATEPIDEILVSTLDPRMSRWLRLDLPVALERRYHLPVTTLISETADVT